MRTTASPLPPSPPRFLCHTLVRGLIPLLGVMLVVLAVQAALTGLQAVWPMVSAAVLNLAALLLVPLTASVYAWSVCWLERRPAGELSLHRAAPELSAGLGLGVLLFSSVMAVLWMLGEYRVTGITLDVALVLTTAALGAFTSAFVQELFFRGVLLRLVEERFGTWPALLGSSVVFGAMHLISPSATLFSSAAVALEGGLLLGAAYLLTRRLWLAVGLHAAWDFANDGVYGVAVSGTTGHALPAVLRGEVTGPSWLTGGAFGVEASPVALVLVMLAAGGLLWWADRQGLVRHRQPPGYPASPSDGPHDLTLG